MMPLEINKSSHIVAAHAEPDSECGANLIKKLRLEVLSIHFSYLTTHPISFWRMNWYSGLRSGRFTTFPLS